MMQYVLWMFWLLDFCCCFLWYYHAVYGWEASKLEKRSHRRRKNMSCCRKFLKKSIHFLQYIQVKTIGLLSLKKTSKALRRAYIICSLSTVCVHNNVETCHRKKKSGSTSKRNYGTTRKTRKTWPFTKKKVIYKRMKRAKKAYKLIKRMTDEAKLDMIDEFTYNEIEKEASEITCTETLTLFLDCNGTSKVVSLPKASSVQDMYDAVAKRIDREDMASFCLLHEGKPLKASLRIVDYNICDGDWLHLQENGVIGGVATVDEVTKSQLSLNEIKEFNTNLPPSDTIRRAINQKFDKRFRKDSKGNFMPYVCTVCDELMLEQDISLIEPHDLYKRRSLLLWQNLEPNYDHCDQVEKQYVFPIDECLKFSKKALKNLPRNKRDFQWLKGMALSPRGCYVHQELKYGKPEGLSCCDTCCSELSAGKVPFWSIFNKNFVGDVPDCLSELTDVELALITPVRKHGFCFSYVGGQQLNLKGTMVYLRVNERRIARGVMQLEALGLNKHVIVVSSGNMTADQKKKVKAKARIRTDKVIAAIEWLCKNNYRWSSVDLTKLREDLENTKPIFVDNSWEVESQDSNIEEKEVFSCYYPDGNANTKAGGFDDPEAFKQFVEKLQDNQFDVEFKCDLQKSFCTGDEDDFVDSLLPQFPYGRGGMDEIRLQDDGTYTEKVDLVKYVQHLSRLSKPVFHTAIFNLMVYSLITRDNILSNSRFVLRGKHSASTIANGLNPNDLNTAIQQRRAGNRFGGTQASKALLNTVDAVSTALPHTNAASKRARGIGESMQHHFGTGSIFLTVTPDDDNSIILQGLSGVAVDDGTPINLLSDEELAKRSARRTELRLNFPGLTTVNFEVMLDILCKEVIGWDMKTNEAVGDTNLFGKVEAMTMAVEEQGRKSLHAHIVLWIKNYRDMMKAVQFGNYSEKRTATWELQKYHERLTTTTFFGTASRQLQKSFKHGTCKPEDLPMIVDLQGLRTLRHRKGYEACKGCFARCPNCLQSYTYEDLVNAFLINGCGVRDTTEAHQNTPQELGKVLKKPKDRLRAMIVEYQRNESMQQISPYIIHGFYQHHVSCHVKGCFKCSTKPKTHQCCNKQECECRYRLPDLSRQRTMLRVCKEDMAWYTWTGEVYKMNILEFLPKRNAFDLFQNVCCQAISESKMTCNSNLALLTEGPITQYQFKYILKETQKDDGAEYAKVAESMKSMGQARIHEKDRTEALRRVCRASFAHNKTNIISAPMAAYITRHGSRFYFSHKFEYCPIQDISNILLKQNVTGSVCHHGEVTFFENAALHYLCRSKELEDVSAYQFFEEYNVVRNTAKRKESETPLFPFEADTGHFKHPSFNKKTGKVLQAVTPKQNPSLAKISQWMFPDAAGFKGDLITSSHINKKMEKYSRLILIIALPHRSEEDLRTPGTYFPYTTKLRSLFQQDSLRRMRQQEPIIFTDRFTNLLQNIQDARSNSLRYKVEEDDLQSRTKGFQPPCAKTTGKEDEEDEEAVDTYDDFLQKVDDIMDDDDDEPDLSIRRCIRVSDILNKGKNRCGHQTTVKPESTYIPNPSEPFLKETNNGAATGTNSSTAAGNASAPNMNPSNKRYTVPEIVRIILKRTEARTRKNVFHDENVKVPGAVGSAASIIQWAKAANLDGLQRRAFESIMASFLLTFYDDEEALTSEESNRYNDRSRYRKSYNFLRILRGGAENQLVALLHGPGGSGKSTVINLVKAYAKEYCEYMKHPFNRRTIVITAMSGVAATLLQGETTHSALGTNRQEITSEEKEAWSDTRLLVVDEISFADSRMFQQIDENLRELKNQKFKIYGGINVVFAGDYSQLEPPKSTPIYMTRMSKCPEFFHFVNAFIELDGMHRFKEDKEWGLMLKRFRDGNTTLQDIRKINRECLVDDNDTRTIPRGTQFATYYNKERDALNTNQFKLYCEEHVDQSTGSVPHALVIIMDELHMKDNKNLYSYITNNKVKRLFWEQCGEDNCARDRGRVDPLLKLYPGCPLMLTQNTDVESGQANGTRVTLQQVVLKTGETTFPLQVEAAKKKFVIKAVYASQVNHIVLKHMDSKIVPQQFNVEPQLLSFKAKMKLQGEKVTVAMKGKQFQLVSNAATTGHKLQGSTVQSLMVTDWMYKQNWPYVVLSRVTTIKGLFLRKPLSEDLKKYVPNKSMVTMLKKFANTKSVPMITSTQYEQMEQEYNP